MVFLLALGLCSNMVAHYVFRTTWHRFGYHVVLSLFCFSCAAVDVSGVSYMYIMRCVFVLCFFDVKEASKVVTVPYE